MSLIGSPPTLEWIGVDQLSIDAAYQRSIDAVNSLKLIRSMVRQWDWRLCQPLAVVRRDDGEMYVVDGQHRLAGAIARGDVPHLPCVVTRPETVAAEAEMFVALNTRRRQLSQSDIFNASLAAGDAAAIEIRDTATRLGFAFARHSNPTAWKPGEIHCGPMLQRALKVHGREVVTNAMTALGEAHAGQILSIAATLLKALFVIYSDDARRPGFDPDAFIEGLGGIPHPDWLDAGHMVRQKQPGLSRIDALAGAMMEAHDAAKANMLDRTS